jgi:hypothetical protein
MNAITRIARNAVSLTISRIGLNPTVAKSFKCAFIPIADIETTSNQVDSVCSEYCKPTGIRPALLMATSSANETTNHGNNGGVGVPAGPPT